MVAMIIKGLFKRYERWNPVHPTYGAFWGMGVGIGCGVGWGPGFGPEVIGYVGSGCGVGFSIGITLAGVGIGLPANFVTDVPYKGYELSNNISSQFSTLQQKANESFSYLKDLDLMKKGTDVFDVKSALCSQGKLISENFRILKKNLPISSKENKD